MVSCRLIPSYCRALPDIPGAQLRYKLPPPPNLDITIHRQHHHISGNTYKCPTTSPCRRFPLTISSRNTCYPANHILSAWNVLIFLTLQPNALLHHIRPSTGRNQEWWDRLVAWGPSPPSLNAAVINQSRIIMWCLGNRSITSKMGEMETTQDHTGRAHREDDKILSIKSTSLLCARSSFFEKSWSHGGEACENFTTVDTIIDSNHYSSSRDE